jgi:hypothetical protein
MTVLLIVGLIGLASVACGSSSTTSTSTTAPPADGAGVSGTVTAGPTCPVERPDQPCPPDPVAAATIDAIDTAGHIAQRATTDSAGRYSISLRPGGYTLQVSLPEPFPVCPDTSVTVTAGSVVTGDILCDTGIR